MNPIEEAVASDEHVLNAQDAYRQAALQSDNPVDFPFTEEGRKLIAKVATYRVHAAVKARKRLAN